MKALVLTASSLLFNGCVAVVKGFDLDRAPGTWYEIARPDHRFEHGG
ncbi:MAG: hypothetical protein P8X54_01195 [Desulfuromonadales bacterium]|jgi:lipocalin